jgi:hypothetical protein
MVLVEYVKEVTLPVVFCVIHNGAIPITHAYVYLSIV